MKKYARVKVYKGDELYIDRIGHFIKKHNNVYYFDNVYDFLGERKTGMFNIYADNKPDKVIEFFDIEEHPEYFL